MESLGQNTFNILLFKVHARPSFNIQKASKRKQLFLNWFRIRYRPSAKKIQGTHPAQNLTIGQKNRYLAFEMMQFKRFFILVFLNNTCYTLNNRAFTRLLRAAEAISPTNTHSSLPFIIIECLYSHPKAHT